MKSFFQKNRIWLFAVVVLVIFMCSVSVIGMCKNANSEAATDEAIVIPAYSGTETIILNNNVPSFASSEITSISYERYGELDELGRCTPAMACIGEDLMPTKERESIAEVKPTGWKQNKYPGLVDTDPPFLYNRCHMIAYQLTGENANVQNLITGTRCMNEAMIPYENEVGDYVRSTGYHVMYRVTPIFSGDNLLCDGVRIEALSVEDKGRGVSFNVYCYNVQPGVVIDYKDGSNKIEEDDNFTSLEDFTKGVPDGGTKGIGDDTTKGIPDYGEKEVTDNTSKMIPDDISYSYVGNRNSHVFHRPECDSVNDMKEKNKVYLEGTRDDAIDQGFRPCQRCNP
ncbi:DNA/RNA non-specific endonuclease [Butyrivibrio sp. AD3002]|uniref:DNA/RNA non-specific endonuclease n=1 Tax=Butyrivibrio sp. AD3002 TaxID=1280670 RepID=UPI0003B36852|nr:DNA/RNA non-specific endonuclease [Butyrivibrio sp. AD3002]